METIDMTPTWEEMVPTLIAIIRNTDNPKGIRDVTGELKRMARLADAKNADLKAEKK